MPPSIEKYFILLILLHPKTFLLHEQLGLFVAEIARAVFVANDTLSVHLKSRDFRTDWKVLFLGIANKQKFLIDFDFAENSVHG